MAHDLHSHTTASDGRLSPTELVRDAAAAGLRTLAVTDHDTVAGTAEAVAAGREAGVDVIAGIEISAVTAGGRNIHVLGYFPDPDRCDLAGFQAERRRERHERVLRIIAQLRAAGIDLSEDEVFRDVDERCTVGRPHVARALLRAGHVGGIREAFDRYLGPDGAGFVECPRLSTADAIAMVRERGGVCSVAHPRVDDLDGSLDRLREEGMQAIEVFHPNHDAGAVRRYLSAVERLCMLATGGSDYHGTENGEGAELGSVTLPEEHFERFAAALGR